VGFQLRITISGLCLFVHEAGERKLHVLMPATPPKSHETHLPRLVFSGDYIGQGGPNGQPREERYDISSSIYDFSSHSSAPQPTPLPVEFPRLSKLGQRRVKARHFRDPVPSERCTGHLVFDWGVPIRVYNTAVVSFNGRRQTVAACASIVLDDVDEDVLQLPGVEPALVPISQNIDLFFGNMMEGDYAHPPEMMHVDPGAPIHHFRFMYDLLEDGHDTVIPTAGNANRGGGVNPLMCLLGGGCEQDPNC